MLILRSENVGNFQRMQEIGKTVGAYSAGWLCHICIHGFSYDHHYRAASQARALLISIHAHWSRCALIDFTVKYEISTNHE